MTRNRRSTLRYFVALPAQMTIGDERHEVTIRDLSRGGASVEFDRRLTLGQSVQILFHIPTRDEPIDVHAIVRWSSINSVGINFQGLRPGDVWALNKYFESLD